MGKAECPIINAIGNWVLRSIDLSGQIFGGPYQVPKPKYIGMQTQPALPSGTERKKILEQMDKQPFITGDSTPVASLDSHTPYYIRTEYNAEADKAKTGCINEECPAYWRYAGVACLGCTKKDVLYNFWLPPLIKPTRDLH